MIRIISRICPLHKPHFEIDGTCFDFEDADKPLAYEKAREMTGNWNAPEVDPEKVLEALIRGEDVVAIAETKHSDGTPLWWFFHITHFPEKASG